MSHNIQKADGSADIIGLQAHLAHVKGCVSRRELANAFIRELTSVLFHSFFLLLRYYRKYAQVCS